MVKNISFALVSGGNFPDRDGKGSAGEDILDAIVDEDIADPGLGLLFVGLGDRSPQYLFFLFSNFASSTSERGFSS
jgi:hypothetical protein